MQHQEMQHQEMQHRMQEHTQAQMLEPLPTYAAESALTNAKDAMDDSSGALEGVRQDFGEVLRHELNNPLTGILGNAELLLAEIHRNDDGRLPIGGLQRLETIAALAVRLRETIRRLSQEWELRDVVAKQKNDG
jgi:signal transduction histidine kinase